MPFINGQPIPNTEVNYGGETFPPVPPLAPIPFDPTIKYAGHTYPPKPQLQIISQVDLSNNPSAITIGNVTLPASTHITPVGEKIIAESQIIDGVSVFEHISRKPYEFDFKIMVWDTANGVFPQQQINDIWNGIWIDNTVQTIKNTFINGLGVQQVIVKSIRPVPRLGSTIVDIVIKCLENQPGTLFV